ncbi:MAG: Flap endonuclease 1 [Candidatus Woesearchaeota archaeon]|nr:Flap endonuclease 1 [Candidatus Woesearchaeota archaeon]
MGTNLKDLIEFKEISFQELQNKKVVIDTYNMLYQFLSNIRQRDGSLLRDSKGNVTSHLTGLLSRTIKFLELGLKPAFVFDGEPPELKQKERNRRKKLKLQAKADYENAKAKGDIKAMRKYASRTSRLTAEMVDESKELIRALGCPVIQAPCEGEAQAAHIVNNRDAFAVVSQDYDTLLYGAKKIIKNLSISKRKKQRNKLVYDKQGILIIDFEDNLSKLGISREQLIVLAILIGTDFNIGGVKGIGPKRGFKLVKKSSPEQIFKQVDWEFEPSWKEIFEIFTKMPVTDDYDLIWQELDYENLKKILSKHDFSKQRIDKTIKRLNKISKKKQQTGLGEFL